MPTMRQTFEADAATTTGARRDALLMLASVERRFDAAVMRLRQARKLSRWDAAQAVHASPDGVRLMAEWIFLYRHAYPRSQLLNPALYAVRGAA
jgi:hypothetical protein